MLLCCRIKTEGKKNVSLHISVSFVHIHSIEAKFCSQGHTKKKRTGCCSRVHYKRWTHQQYFQGSRCFHYFYFLRGSTLHSCWIRKQDSKFLFNWKKGKSGRGSSFFSHKENRNLKWSLLYPSLGLYLSAASLSWEEPLYIISIPEQLSAIFLACPLNPISLQQHKHVRCRE